MGKFLSVVLLLVFLNTPLLGSNTYTGTFSTQSIRLLWMACYQGVMMADPRNPEFNGALCDCVVNTTREKYTADQVNKYQGATMQRKYTEMANQCKAKLALGITNEELT